MINQFFDRIAVYENQEALIWQNMPMSYRELIQNVNEWPSFFKKNKVQSGKSIALSGEVSFQFIHLFLALIQHRNIILPLSTLTASDHECYQSIGNVFCKFVLDEKQEWSTEYYAEEKVHPLLDQLKKTNDAGLILFSSSTTGKPKAILHSFSQLFEKWNIIKKPYRTISFLSFDHIGGINTLFHTLSQGGTLIIPENRKPETICQLIEKHRVELLPTTPTFLTMLLISEQDKHYDLSSLRMITYGAESMPKTTLATIAKRFPYVRFKQTYGTTELGIIPTTSYSNESTWIKIGGDGYDVRIKNGTLWIRSSQNMLGYLNMDSCMIEEGWIDTEDMVEIKDDYFRILGRKSDVINVGGEKVFPQEIENIIAQLPNIKDVIVKGKPNSITGNIIVAIVQLCQQEEEKEVSLRIRKACRAMLPAFKVPALIMISTHEFHGDRFKKIRKNV